MQAPKKSTPEIRKPKPCGIGQANEPAPGTADLPDANVAKATERCLVPPHAESTRLDTGEPCEDGRDGE